jgi:hypothetical protein
MFLEIHQAADAIPLGEPWYLTESVLVDSSEKIMGNASVEDTRLAREDIDPSLRSG